MPRSRVLIARTKKDQILERWNAGERSLWQIATGVGTTPSYVASTLQDAGKIHGYSDLFTNPDRPMNIYSEVFRDRLGFKNDMFAKASVDLIDRAYERLGEIGDRAGQHHCFVVALTMYHRARASGKSAQAKFFRRWMVRKLREEDDDLASLPPPERIKRKGARLGTARSASSARSRSPE